jgi:regulatory protein
MVRPPLSLKGRALRYLSGREHSRLELERKLSAHEETPGELVKVLDELAAKGFISEQRVADSVVHRRGARLGAARVKQELAAKGLAPELIKASVAKLQDTEVERAQAVWRARFRTPAADAPTRLKQMRFLAARGFSAEAIRKAVPGVGTDEG